MSDTKAVWWFDLDCRCPHCGEYLNLNDARSGEDEEGFLNRHSFKLGEHDTAASRNVSFGCNRCKGTFTADLVVGDLLSREEIDAILHTKTVSA